MAREWRRAFRIRRGKRDVARDVNAEIEFHVEMRTRKLIAAGLEPAAARERALAQFGDLPAVRDECLTIDYQRERAMKISDAAAALRQDLRFAVRALRKQPSFTITAVLLLAIGIGANTAMFTLVDALLIRALPVAHPEQLVSMGNRDAVGNSWSGSPMTDYVSYPVFTDLKDRNTVLSDIYATGGASGLDVSMTGATEPARAEHPRARLVSGTFFHVLGAPSIIGRTFSAEEDRVPGGEPYAVLSYDYWKTRFAGDESVVGRTISANGVPITIIGVTGPRFTGDIVGGGTDLWLPIAMQPALWPTHKRLDDRSSSWLLIMGRLKPGVTLPQARAELAAIETQSIRAHLSGVHLKEFDADLKATPVLVEAGGRGFSRYRAIYAPALAVLMAAVVLVALVVCANVANLLLTRSITRGREMTVRMTLGAGRVRLVQQLLVESLLLAAAGAALGLVLAYWGSRLTLIAASAGATPIPLDVRPDWRVLLFTAAVTVGSSLLFGLAPALRATRVELATALRAHGRTVFGARGRLGRFAAGKALVVAQVALSTLLLIGTGLLVRSMREILRADLGLDRDRLVMVDVSSGRRGYLGTRLDPLVRDLADRVARVPGVAGVSYSDHGVFSGGDSNGHVTVAGFTAQADSDGDVAYDAAGPNYFHILGAHLLRGRDFDEGDSEGAAKVAVVNTTMAKFYFKDADPIGRSVTLDSTTYTVIGVVRDIEEQDVRAKPERRMYMPFFQTPRGRAVVLEVRAAGDPSGLVQPLRKAVLAADPALPVDVDPLNDLVRASVAQDGLVAQVTAFFGALVLMLGALGLYGVTSYTTSQRTGEIGLRYALGAEPRLVTRMILRESVALAALGVSIGVPAGLLAARLIRGQLFGVGAMDPPSLAGAVAVLIVTAAIAAWLPARRAGKVDPLEALRAE